MTERWQEIKTELIAKYLGHAYAPSQELTDACKRIAAMEAERDELLSGRYVADKVRALEAELAEVQRDADLYRDTCTENGKTIARLRAVVVMQKIIAVLFAAIYLLTVARAWYYEPGSVWAWLITAPLALPLLAASETVVEWWRERRYMRQEEQSDE